MTALHVLRVFCDPAGDYGNPLGVVLDGDAVAGQAARQRVAHELGFSETVFVDDRTTGALQIFTPQLELPLAGHPLVGAAWLLAHNGGPLTHLRPPAGAVECGATADGAWFRADPADSPPWRTERYTSAAEVEGLNPDDRPADANDYCWAWLDEAVGVVRARSFAPGAGIREDEATGSAALVLCGELARPIRIIQGEGSVIDARPAADGRVGVGGLVVLDEVRELT
jgi:predicted PhzF superfamily epimerase YddE/YHI9